MLKKCSKCLIEKELTEFNKDNRNADGLVGVCKVCRKECNKQYGETHREEISINKKQYYKEHREEELVQNKRYYDENRQQILVQVKQYNAARKEERIVYDEQYYVRHREKRLAQMKKWRKRNPDKLKTNNQNRRARKNGSTGAHSAKEWENLKEKYNYTCLRCGRKEPEIKLTEDHVVPLKCAGSNDIENIQPLCKSCNCSKNTKSIDYRQS